MQNEPNFSKSQMFITIAITSNYSEKCKLDTWSKRTQTNPIYGEQSRTIYQEIISRVLGGRLCRPGSWFLPSLTSIMTEPSAYRSSKTIPYARRKLWTLPFDWLLQTRSRTSPPLYFAETAALNCPRPKLVLADMQTASGKSVWSISTSPIFLTASTLLRTFKTGFSPQPILKV